MPDAAEHVLDYHFRSFAHQVVPRLVKEGIAVLGMKPMAFGNVLKTGAATPDRMPALCSEFANVGGD